MTPRDIPRLLYQGSCNKAAITLHSMAAKGTLPRPIVLGEKVR